MRTKILPLFAVAVSLLCSTGAARAAGGIRWGNSLQTAMVEAKKTGRLIMVDFYTDWCGFCKKLDAETYTDPTVIKEATQLIPLKLDAEREGRPLAERLQPRGFPVIYFLNGNGEVEGMIGGFEPPVRFLTDMRRFIQTHRDLPVLQSRLRANPSDLPTAARLTAIYAGMHKHKEARQTLARVTQLDPGSRRGYLTEADLAVGQMWMEGKQADEAVPLIREAARTAHKPEERAVAHINLALCYGRMNSLDACMNELNTTIRLPDCPPQVKQAAQQLLTRIQQSKSQHR